MFEHYVGEVVPYFAGVPELPVFSIHGSKALVKVFYNSPTAEEIEQFDAGKSFEIRMIRSNDVLFLCYKIGALNWMDNAYDAALCTDEGCKSGLYFILSSWRFLRNVL